MEPLADTTTATHIVFWQHDNGIKGHPTMWYNVVSGLPIEIKALGPEFEVKDAFMHEWTDERSKTLVEPLVGKIVESPNEASFILASNEDGAPVLWRTNDSRAPLDYPDAIYIQPQKVVADFDVKFTEQAVGHARA